MKANFNHLKGETTKLLAFMLAVDTHSEALSLSEDQVLSTLPELLTTPFSTFFEDTITRQKGQSWRQRQAKQLISLHYFPPTAQYELDLQLRSAQQGPSQDIMEFLAYLRRLNASLASCLVFFFIGCLNWVIHILNFSHFSF